MPQVEEIPCLAQGCQLIFRHHRRPVVDVAARCRQVLADLGLFPLLTEIGVRLHLVRLGLVGEEAHPVTDGNIAAVSCEFWHAAVVHQHGDAVFVDALRLRTGYAGAVAHPLAALELQHVMVDGGLPCRPPVAEEHVSAVVGRLDLQRHGQFLRDVDIARDVVADDPSAVGQPRQPEHAEKDSDGEIEECSFHNRLRPGFPISLLCSRCFLQRVTTTF